MQAKLSSLQLATLNMIPREWAALENMAGWSGVAATLVTRGVAERKKLGDTWLYRRKPMTFRQAVDRLLDRLPTNEATLDRMGLLDEVRELRRIRDALPAEEVCSGGRKPFMGEYDDNDVRDAQHLMGIAS